MILIIIIAQNVYFSYIHENGKKCLDFCDNENGYYLQEDTYNCFKDVPSDDYYLDFNKKIFKKCYYKCKTCIKDESKNIMICNPCNDENFINTTYKCDEFCNNFYFENGELICLNRNKSCPQILPYELTINRKYINDCSGEDFLTLNCQTNSQNLYNINITIDNIRKAIKNESFIQIIEKFLNNGSDIIKKENNIIYQLTTIKNQNNNLYGNISTINISACRDELINQNIISENDTLLIYKIDYFSQNNNWPFVFYEIYSLEKKQKLNLTCSSNKIIINKTADIDENNIYLYDPNSNFYHDICFTYTSKFGTDIILNDRKKEFIENNLYLCENDCNIIGYDMTQKRFHVNVSRKTCSLYLILLI